MEDYEKLYKDALAKAREIHRNENEKRSDMEWLFPEIKESEDERIRKALIRFHKSTIDIDGIKGDRIVAWLEKQGYTKKDIDNAYLKGICDTKHELEKQGEQKPAVVDFNAKDWYVSKVDGKIHDMTYNPTNKAEPKFKVKYAGSEYNVLEVKDIAGVTFYGIEDEPNHIDYVKAENCEIISGYAIKENGSPYPTKPAAWSDEDEEMTDDVIKGCVSAEKAHHFIHTPKEVADWLKSIKDRIGG